ncbi:MAG: BTAD domain-containing putative transcriptional regulator [Gemmatimonadaceae bacterium]
MTVHLRTLGQIHLRDDAGVELRSLLTQPKRLAILVYLASAGGRMVRRDSLLAMFWPESDAERARGALRQAIHFIKAAAGSEVVVSRGADELGLAVGAVHMDASSMEEFESAGRHAEAASLHGGDFLDGFYVKGAPTFERWVETERARLRKRAADSAWLASEACARAGDATGARQMGERALALSANDETAVRRFISLLAGSGDRAGALAVYQDFASQMAKEYGVAPSPETRALLAALETAPPPSAAERVTVLPPRAEPAAAQVSVRPAPRQRVRRRIPAFVAATVAIVGIASVALFRPDLGRADVASEANRMAVLPFVVRGPATLRYLEDGLPILLGTRLDGAGSLRTVDARALLLHLADEDRESVDAKRAREVATRFGAQLYVLGSIVAVGDSLRFSASLYDRAHGSDPVAHTEVSGTETELVHVVDRLASELLAARFREVGGNISETAARTTSSLPALKAWLAGEAAITAGRYAAAMVPLREAIALDSNFAVAHFRLAVAANWAALPKVVDEEAKRAVALSNRLSPSTRLVLQAFLDQRLGAYAHAGQVLRTVLAEQPSSTEAWYELGEVLFHSNPAQGRSLTEARTAFETALRLDPHNFSAAIHLARIAAVNGDRVALDSLSKTALDSNPDGAQRGEIVLLRALALRDAGDRSRFLALPATIEEIDALWRTVEFTGNLAMAYEIADSLTRRAPTSEIRDGLHLFLAHVAAGRGDFTRAGMHLDSAALHAPQTTAVTRLLFAVHPGLPAADRAAWLARANADASPFPRYVKPRTLYSGYPHPDSVAEQAVQALAFVRLARGDSSLARRVALDVAPTGTLNRAMTTEMRLVLATTHDARVAALKDVAVLDTLYGSHYAIQTVVAPRARYHLALAKVLEDEGRVAEALARLQAVPENFGFNVAYLPEVQRRRAALLDKLGRRDEAAALRRAVQDGIR